MSEQRPDGSPSSGADARPAQREIATAALRVVEGAGFALAGSGAIREHGIVDRPTEDIDLFTSRVDETSFAEAIRDLLAEFDRLGWSVHHDETRTTRQFTRLRVERPSGIRVQLDLGMDWREHPAVRLDIGPVLDVDDAVFSKLAALYSRAAARDFLDVDAIRRSGRYTDDELLAGAADRDPGFDLRLFAAQLDRVRRLDLAQVARYGVDSNGLEQMRSRILEWAAQIGRDAP